jgi:hypothetical protein
MLFIWPILVTSLVMKCHTSKQPEIKGSSQPSKNPFLGQMSPFTTFTRYISHIYSNITGRPGFLQSCTTNDDDSNIILPYTPRSLTLPLHWDFYTKFFMHYLCPFNLVLHLIMLGLISLTIFCEDMAPWSLVEVDRRFRGAYYLHHQDDDCPLLWDYMALYPRRLS